MKRLNYSNWYEYKWPSELKKIQYFLLEGLKPNDLSLSLAKL